MCGMLTYLLQMFQKQISKKEYCLRCYYMGQDHVSNEDFNVIAKLKEEIK